MKIDIQARHIELNQQLKEHIQRKLQFSLNRFERYIGGVSIGLSDVNGPKGGFDKQCTIQVFLEKMEDVVVKDIQANLPLAIDRAMQRSSRSVARKINQKHKQQNQRRRSKTNEEIDSDVLLN